MLSHAFRSMLFCAVVVAASQADLNSSGGKAHGFHHHRDAPITCRPWDYGSPDLFYNFYTQGFCNTAHAQMYPAPYDVPPLVGQTYYTYQPFYPHEYLYRHHRHYHRYYDEGRGLNRTHVSWYYPPVRTSAVNLYWGYLRIPR